jgi:photosystem II stability/assembly factor-like uncharacterized protein
MAIGLFLVTASACRLRPDTTLIAPAISAANTQIHFATLTDTPIQPAILAGTPIPPTPDLPIVPLPVLVRIDFKDTAHGWGIASNGSGYILRTVDGGATWLNATPLGVTGIGRSTGFFALNVNTVWIQIPNIDFFTGTLYHTTDGGVSWTSTPVPFGEADIQFLDASTGRLLANRGAGAGSNAVELYQTTDGGSTWVSVFHNDPIQPGSSDALPLSGIKNGMIFLDANTGWVSGSRPVAGVVYLYITQDGGVSWGQQTIPLPQKINTNQFLVQAPAFIGQDGYLPILVYYPDTVVQTFFISHDGGTTWSGDPTDMHKIILNPCVYSFADALNGFCWNGGTDLYYTRDGSSSWANLKPDVNLSGQLTQLEFIPGTAGKFTGWALTNVDDTGHSQLFQTTDSGSNWIPLIH